jgi:hypothetical protein
VWTITSAEEHRLLTVDRGWSAERYRTWLAGSLTSLLLPAAGDPTARLTD